MRALDLTLSRPLLGLALAVALIAPAEARQRPPGGPGGPQRAGGPGGPQGPPGQVPGAPGTSPGVPGASPAAPAPPRPGAPAPDALPPVDTSPLGRYIPGDSVWVYFEFPGLNAFPDAWQATAARGLLNETPLGEMLREIVGQLPGVSGKPTKLAPADATLIAEHLAQHGLVIASPGETSRPGGNYTIVVLRNAAHKSARVAFGKLLGQMTPEGVKPKVTPKPGGRQIVFVDRLSGSPPADPAAPPAPPATPGAPPAAPTPPAPAGGPEGTWAYWVEQNDIVIALVDGNAADEVIAVLDGTRPSIADNEALAALRAPEGTFTPAAFGLALLDRPGASPEIKRIVDQHGIKQVDLRWGFDGKALTTITRVEAPSPRKGAMVIVDQPGFSPTDLPPLPPQVESFSTFSVQPDRLFDQLGAILDQFQPGLGSSFIKQSEEAVRSKTRMDLRADLLAKIGPRITAFQTAGAAPAPPGRGGPNPLAGLMGSLGGLKVPEVTLLIEAKDAKAVEPALDGLILALNDQLKTVFAVAPAQAGAGGPAPGGPGGDRKPAAPEPPKFQLTTIQPKTYTLMLPAGLAALTGASPTITMGKGHIIFATTPVAARNARDLESEAGGARWGPDSETAEAFSKLPSNLLFLGYTDITETMPQELAGLPTLLQKGVANVLAGNFPSATPPSLPAMAGPAPGGPAGGPGGGRGGSSSGGSSISSSGDSTGRGPGPQDYGSSSLGSSSGSSGSSSSGSSGSSSGSSGSGTPAGGPPKPGTIRVDPAKIPTPEALRKYLFPSTHAIVVEDRGVRIESREAIPSLAFLKILASTPAPPEAPAGGAPGQGAPGVPPGSPQPEGPGRSGRR